MSTDSLREKYFERLRFAKRSELTIVQYNRKLSQFNQYLVEHYGLTLDTEEDVRQINGMMISEYQQSLRASGVSDASEASHVAALRCYFNWLARMVIIPPERNPVGALVNIRVPQKEQAHFSWSEAQKMVQNYASRNYTRDMSILGIALQLGLRVSSIIKLNIGDLDVAEKKLSFINKGGARRSIYVPDALMATLMRHISENRLDASPEEPFFVSERGERLSEDMVRRICKKAGGTIGKKATPHALRRTCLTRVKEVQGMALAREIAQHSNDAVTARYIYSTPEEMEAVYNRMSLFSFDKPKS